MSRHIIPRATYATPSTFRNKFLQSVGSRLGGATTVHPTTENITHILSDRRSNFVRVDLESSGLVPLLQSAIRSVEGIQQFTPTQAALIPAMLHGRSMVVQSETGSGKSFGIMLAAVNRIVRQNVAYRCHTVIVVPTEALAIQYEQWIRTYLGTASHIVMPCIDSISLEDQLSRLQNLQPHILVGTSGRLFEIQSQASKLLGHSLRRMVDTLVVDEADLVFVQKNGIELVDRLYRRMREEVPAQLILASASMDAHTVKKFNKWTENDNNVLRLSTSHMEHALPENLTFFLYCNPSQSPLHAVRRLIQHGKQTKGSEHRSFLEPSRTVYYPAFVSSA